MWTGRDQFRSMAGVGHNQNVNLTSKQIHRVEAKSRRVKLRAERYIHNIQEVNAERRRTEITEKHKRGCDSDKGTTWI